MNRNRCDRCTGRDGRRRRSAPRGARPRFVGEMEEIADFVGEDPQAQQMYEAFAEFYTRIAADHQGRREETGALSAFLKKST